MAVSCAPFSYTQAKQITEHLQNTYPGIGLHVLGRSWAKRGIFAYTVGTGEESVLLLGGLSAQDTAAPLILYRFLERLCRSEQRDKTLRAVKIRNTLRERRVTVIPCLNPDAYEIRQFGALGAGCYAGLVGRAVGKSYANWCANARGVHITHNFAYAHTPILPKDAAQGKQPQPSPCAYAGPAAESEAETTALVRLCGREAFRHAVVLSGTGGYVHWAAPDAPTEKHDAPMAAKILASAGGYKLANMPADARHGCFAEWFAGEFDKPVYEIAPTALETLQTRQGFDALYAQIEEMLVLATIL